MFHGLIPAILFSLIIHAVLFAGLVISVKKPEIKENKTPKVISSFLYTKPKAIQPKAPVEVVPQKDQLTKLQHKTAELKQTNIPAKVVQTQTEQSKKIDKQTPPIDKSVLTQKGEQTDTPRISTKAFHQLEQLKKQIDKRIVEEAVYEKFRRRSPSVLDGAPYTVPHSVQPLTAEQKKAQNTARYSDDISLIKGENGNCTLEQDLSTVGIEGVKAYSFFECGQSTFDRNFKSHMGKVLKKIGK